MTPLSHAERTAVLESVTDAVLISLPGEMPLTEKLTIAIQCRRDLARRLGKAETAASSCPIAPPAPSTAA
jgi:hypothetical protein